MTQSLLVLIPAHNESAVIAQTVAAVMVCLTDSDRLIVIDDGSTDDTAILAERAGAEVARRFPDESTGSKGGALRFWLAKFGRDLTSTDGVIVLDADSVVEPNFFKIMRARLSGGAMAVQGFIQPTGETGSAAAYSTLLEQRLADRLRARLGWSVRLRGTGMAFRADVFGWLLDDLHTEVEDVEMSLALARRGIKVEFAPEAIVFDPLPVTPAGTVRQRARWLRGQAAVWRWHWRTVAGLLGRGPGAWSLLASLLLKPYSLLLVVKLIGGAAAWLLGLRGLVFMLAVWLLFDFAYWISGVWFMDDPVWWLKRLVRLPAFVGVWVHSLHLALAAPASWLRARSDLTPTPSLKGKGRLPSPFRRGG